MQQEQPQTLRNGHVVQCLHPSARIHSKKHLNYAFTGLQTVAQFSHKKKMMKANEHEKHEQTYVFDIHKHEITRTYRIVNV